MNGNDFQQWARKAADWAVAYRRSVATRPVRPALKPGAVLAQIDDAPPGQGVPMEQIFADFEAIVPDGLTHWQHPRFFAYFPSSAAPAAVIAEQLVAGMAVQCMLWQTSPAATELEIKMVDWLRQAVGLSDQFKGTIQDTASSATLAAILTMRERALGFSGNQEGLFNKGPLRIYASGRTHSSIDKAVWIAGIGQQNLVKIATKPDYSMDCDALRAAIEADLAQGLTPAGVVACVGGTSIGACDDVAAVCDIAEEFGLYSHIDAAWAGSAMICPEFRHHWKGADDADSIVFNPHKWLGTSMECSIHLIKDPTSLVRTLAIQPEYLKTRGHDGVINFSEWSVQLGRRFRALKVWFLLRAYGLEGLQGRIRDHVRWTDDLAQRLGAEPDFEITTSPFLALFSFRFCPKDHAGSLDDLNLRLVDAINDDGRTYLTQTNHDGTIVIRLSIGQFETSEEDIEIAFQAIVDVARGMERRTEEG